MNALVTGVAGFIGSTLAGRLLDQGARVTGIDCFTDYYPRPVKEANVRTLLGRPGFEFVESTIQAANLTRLLAGTTHVFHLAAQAGVRKSWGRDFDVYTTNNIEATQVLLEACVGTAVERLVYASSSSVYGDDTPLPMRETAVPAPLSPYGVTKLAAEHLCNLYHANHGVPCVSLRYFTVYGPRQRPDLAIHKFARILADGGEIEQFGDGGSERDYTYVDDIVDGVVRVIDRPFRYEVFNLGAGRMTDLRTLIKTLASALGKMAVIDEQPLQPGDALETQADVSKARRMLGYEPQFTVETGIPRFVDWFRQNNAASQAASANG